MAVKIRTRLLNVKYDKVVSFLACQSRFRCIKQKLRLGRAEVQMFLLGPTKRDLPSLGGSNARKLVAFLKEYL